MSIIFHITKRHDWEFAKSSGTYRAKSLDSEGFIHCSRHYQVCEVANFLFKDQTDLILLAIDENKVDSEIKYEGPTWNRFPHIYGGLNANSVVAAFPFLDNPEKGFEFPHKALQLAVQNLSEKATGPGYDIPQHYDAMNGSEGSDVSYYAELAKNYPGKILDLACGSGRFSIPIAKSGQQVFGLDLSAPMLNFAKEKVQKQNLNIQFELGDIRLFNLNQKFDFIFCGFNSSQHLHEEKEFRSFLECVRNHLAPKGVFAFDVFNPSIAMLNRDPKQRYLVSEYKDPSGKGQVKVWENPSYEAATQMSHFKFSYEIDENPIIKEEFSLRNYFPLEMDVMLRNSGFNILNKFGNYKKDPFTSNSMKQLYVCS